MADRRRFGDSDLNMSNTQPNTHQIKHDSNIPPRLIIHGGAGSLEGQIERRKAFRESLERITRETWNVLLKDGSRSAVLHGVRLLEDDPIFNAGFGSRIQLDGCIRMSASLMDGRTGTFSGIINVSDVQHPIDLADTLAERRHKVLAGEQATQFARSQGYPVFDPETPARRAEYERRLKGSSGTVGVLALDSEGQLTAGTSTGGVGNETPGRVSDTPTIAGNYCSENAAVSATGIGEDIVNNGTAARIVSLVDAGFTLNQAVGQSIELGREKEYRFGLIAMDRHGNMIADKTCNEIFFASYDGSTLTDFFE